MGIWQKAFGFFLLLVVAHVALAQDQNAERTFTANYKDANILEVVKSVQEATGKLMVVDPRVKGQITVMSSEPLTQKQYYNLFLTALNTLGFTAIESDNIVSIIPNKEARSAPLPFLIPDDNGSQYVQEIFKLDNVSAAQVLPTIRPLVPQGGQSHMAAFPASNVIIMVDTVANIERMRGILEEIDQAAIPETEMVQLDYADAEETVRMLEQIERNVDPSNAGAATKLQVTADKRTNSVLVTGEQRQRGRIKLLIERLDRPQPQSGNARVIYLEYANAEQLASVLTNVMQNLSKLNPDEKPQDQSSVGIEADKDTNSLIVTADIETVNALQGIIQRLDIQRAQVLVEAIIVEVNDNFGRSLGIQWLYRNDDGGFAGNFKEGNNAQTLGAITQGALEQDSQDALETLAGALSTMAGQTLGLGRLGDSYDLLALVDLLQGTTGTNILSTPNLLTTDNHTAKITVGEAVPFVTGSFTSTGDGGSGNPQNPFQTINRENVGTILEVTPHVNSGNKVALDIVQEVSSISQKVGAAGTITNERKIETRVTVKDGETIVLGGLIKDNVIQRETRVPILGSIPILGHLFRSQSTSNEKTNLLVFIRPRIIRDDETLRGATAEKYNYIRDEQLRHREGSSSLLLDEDKLPLLPEWESVLEAMAKNEIGQATDETAETTPTEQTTEQEDEAQ